MVMEFKFDSIVKKNGKKIEQKARGELYLNSGDIYEGEFLDGGLEIYSHAQGVNMKVNGPMIYKMDVGLKFGQIIFGLITFLNSI